MKFNLKIDNEKIIQNVFKNNLLPNEVASELWAKFNEDYVSLRNGNINKDNKILKIDVVKKIISNIITECQTSLKLLEKALDENKNTLEKKVNEICKIKIEDKTYDVYFIPEKKRELIEGDVFLLGNSQLKKEINDDVLFLFKETLKSYFNKDELFKSILYNVVYIELYKTVFGTNNLKIELMQENYIVKQFPFWNLFLNRSDDQIKKEMKNANINYEFKKYKIYRENLKNKNIIEYYEFIKNFNIDNIKIKKVCEIK